MEIFLLILLFIIGSCVGSFLCCEARRLHLRTTSKTSSKLGSRSICLHCKYQLRWYDNIPIISWLFLRGKCRKCHHPIGSAEIISELLMGLAFLMLGTTINLTTADALTWASFILVLVLTASLVFLAIYDGIYGELPTKCLIISIILAAIVLSLSHTAILITSGFTPAFVYQPILSVLILGGLYLALYLISKGKWVGDGDWLFATAIGIALGNPWLALLALFTTNLLACLYALPRLKKTKKIYLGPFLVISFVITYSFSGMFLSFIA